MKRGHVALRTCIGCSGRYPKSDLIRFTLGPDGPVAGRGPGRGYYVCRKAPCLDRALGPRGLSRLLGRPPGKDEVERLRMELLESESSRPDGSPPESVERR